MGEPRLRLVVAHLVVAAPARGTGPAAANKRRRHAFPAAPPPNLWAHGHYSSREFVPRNVGHRGDVRIVTLPTMPIAAAQTGGFDGDYDAVRR